MARSRAKAGKVYLIGAGPGDPGLMTIRGRDVLGKADVVVYDYLVNPGLLEYCREGAEAIYVGKKSGRKELSQKDINELLVRESKRGKTVARLKGGDPFIFGRGGEEAETMSRKKIPYEILPGVSSASAVPAYAGIPLTHRDFTSSFAVVTGHENPSKDSSKIPWESLANIGTVVFLMSVRNLDKNMKKLIASGKPAETPAAVVSWGTYPNQTTVVSTVEDIAEAVKSRKDITSPAVIITGDVVRMRDVIDWYESKPLFGKNIVVTRARGQSAQFKALLSENGANIIYFPVIDIKPPRSFKALDRSIKRIREYDWIIFTSVNGVRAFFSRLKALGKDIRDLYGLRVAAIGEKTASAIEALGIKVDVTPGEYVAESLVKSFIRKDISAKKVLIPRAAVARDLLPQSLKELGADVDVVPCYETRKPAGAQSKRLIAMLNSGKIDLVTFTSSSTARNFLTIIDGKLPPNTLIACIGPVTANTVKELGYKASIIAKKYTIEGLTDEISSYFSSLKSSSAKRTSKKNKSR